MSFSELREQSGQRFVTNGGPERPRTFEERATSLSTFTQEEMLVEIVRRQRHNEKITRDEAIRFMNAAGDTDLRKVLKPSLLTAVDHARPWAHKQYLATFPGRS